MTQVGSYPALDGELPATRKSLILQGKVPYHPLYDRIQPKQPALGVEGSELSAFATPAALNVTTNSLARALQNDSTRKILADLNALVGSASAAVQPNPTVNDAPVQPLPAAPSPQLQSAVLLPAPTVAPQQPHAAAPSGAVEFPLAAFADLPPTRDATGSSRKRSSKVRDKLCAQIVFAPLLLMCCHSIHVAPRLDTLGCLCILTAVGCICKALLLL